MPVDKILRDGLMKNFLSELRQYYLASYRGEPRKENLLCELIVFFSIVPVLLCISNAIREKRFPPK